ncbi:adenosyl-hopene transferase HpnH [Candidatus Nitrosacidococcus tergens]|uniref:Hopanoid biosynthesis associated radical SAM protein HpnH n=1 Tax=Candidatus Nitrosacidococcus tergens TaxID=553981 RepID=A0A7G1Q8T5_9GAMM|nr:adenosyl-hopene transferase HpnH [Candidatus Nitrosacidococcus tergens]CAB1275442.1 Hopanoid biosynthesis associated radical SAM protein HpnH [Candidatus Nitrosacidococcus tergens]
MGIPLIQQYRVGKYILEQKLRGVKRYPLVLMLEPLFQCNLACAGCGKIDYPDETLAKRLSAQECLNAVDECGAPVISIPGGEPLLHKEMPQIVEGIIKRKKFVYLCTNALLLSKRLKDYTPSPYLTFSVHLDGLKEEHDASVCQEGVFDRAVTAIKLCLDRGFRVTINCTLFQNADSKKVAEFFDYCMGLGVEGVTISPGYSYEHAPRQDIFLQRAASKRLFRDIFRLGKGHKWRFNQSSLFLDFLAGNQSYQCTPWGNPTRNIFGWQKPCYLFSEGGYAPTFKALMEETEWERYGTGNHPKCANCMAHCGYEPTAVNDTMAHPIKAFSVFLRGPKLKGPLVPELPIKYSQKQTTSPTPMETHLSQKRGDIS